MTIQVANFDNIYHFKLSSDERARAPTDFRYDSKSRALLSEPCVSYNCFALSRGMIYTYIRICTNK